MVPPLSLESLQPLRCRVPPSSGAAQCSPHAIGSARVPTSSTKVNVPGPRTTIVSWSPSGSGGQCSVTIQPDPPRTVHNVRGAPSTKCSAQGGDRLELPNSEPWARTSRNRSPNMSTPSKLDDQTGNPVYCPWIRPARRRWLDLMSDVIRTAADSLTGQDLEFLGRPLHGFLTVAGGPHPQPRPVWFEATAEGNVQIFTSPDSLKVRRLQRDPWASIVVAAPVGERERWISVAGRITVESDGAHELCSRLAARYWDIGDPDRASVLAEILAAEQVRIVIRPETVRRYAL